MRDGGHEDDRARRRRHRHHDRVLSGQARPRGASGRPPGRRGDGDELCQRRRPAHQRGRALVAARDAEKYSEVAGQRRRADAAALQRAARNVALGARVHPQLLARALPPQHHDQSPPLVLHVAVYQGDPRGDRDRLRSDAKGHAQDLHAGRCARAEPDRMRDDAAPRHGLRGRGRQTLRGARAGARAHRADAGGRTVLPARRARRLPQVHDRPAPALRAEARRALPLRHRSESAAQERRPDRSGRDEQGADERRSLRRCDGQLHARCICARLGSGSTSIRPRVSR